MQNQQLEETKGWGDLEEWVETAELGILSLFIPSICLGRRADMKFGIALERARSRGIVSTWQKL
jgi:hypothetical protein